MTEPPERLIRKADFARLVGVSHPAISKAVRDGRLTPALRMHNGREVIPGLPPPRSAPIAA